MAILRSSVVFGGLAVLFRTSAAAESFLRGPALAVEARSTACQDLHAECAAWELKGRCAADLQYMTKVCPLSCGMCGTAPAPAPASATSRAPAPALPNAKEAMPPAPAPPAKAIAPATTIAPAAGAPAHAPAPAAAAIPGTAACVEHFGDMLNMCYRDHGFIDGDCTCTLGPWEGKISWYLWQCTSKGGKALESVRFCSQDCNNKCEDEV